MHKMPPTVSHLSHYKAYRFNHFRLTFCVVYYLGLEKTFQATNHKDYMN